MRRETTALIILVLVFAAVWLHLFFAPEREETYRLLDPARVDSPARDVRSTLQDEKVRLEEKGGRMEKIPLDSGSQLPEETEREAVYHIQVVTEKKEDPVEGARVRVWDDEREELFAEGTSDSEGKVAFELPSLAEDRSYFVESFKLGYSTGSAWFEEGEEQPWRLFVVPGLPLRGRVIFAESSAPVPGASVILDQWDIFYYPDDLFLTDERGCFEIPAVSKEEPFDISASHPGYGIKRMNYLRMKPGLELTFVLGGNGVIEGKALTPSGETVKGALVWVKRPDAWDVDGQTFTDATGAFRIEGLVHPAAYFAHAFCEEFDFAEGSSGLVEIDQAGSCGAVKIVIHPRKTALSVRVIDERGLPREGVWVEVESPNGNSVGIQLGLEHCSCRAKTGSDGTCRIAPLKPGDYLILPPNQHHRHSRWYEEGP